MATSLLWVTSIPRHLTAIMCPFFLDVGRMPAASRVSIHFQMVSYCGAIKLQFYYVIADPKVGEQPT